MVGFFFHLRTGRRVLSRLGQLSWNERWLLLDALRILWFYRCVLFIFPYSYTRKLLIPTPDHRFAAGQFVSSTISIGQVVWAVSRASLLVLKGQNCLLLALSTRRLLAKWGYQSCLRLGVRKPEPHDLDAHAWVECNGRVVIGRMKDLQQFAPLVSRIEKI